MNESKIWTVGYSLKSNIIFSQNEKIGDVYFTANQKNIDASSLPNDGEFEVSASTLIEEDEPITKTKACEEALFRIQHVILSTSFICGEKMILCGFFMQAGKGISNRVTHNCFPDKKWTLMPLEKSDVDKSIELMELCRKDEDVADVLALLYAQTKPFDLVTLTKALEIIEPDFEKLKLATKDKINNFKGAVNVRKRVGLLQSRHGHNRWDIGKNVMTFDECISFGQNLVNKWLECKLKQGEKP